MKNLFIALALTILAAQAAHAGEAQAVIECASQSGKTKISAVFPGDSMETGVIFSIEGQKLSYMDQNMKDLRDLNDGRIFPEFADAQVAVIESVDHLKDQVFGLQVKSKESGQLLLKIEAVKGTAHLKRTQTGVTGSFSANAQGLDPRTGAVSKLINVNCKYDYEI